MSWWKRKKCATCKKVLKPRSGIHELRIETSEGLHDVEVCGECARFWDGTATVLSKGRKKEESDAE